MDNNSENNYTKNSKYYGQVVAYRCGLKLRELRKNSGKSCAEIAKDLNLSVDAIYSFETGRRFPSMNTQLNIANYYNVAWSDLFNT